MRRRNFLQRAGKFFLASLAGLGLFTAASLLPRPPRKIFLKTKDLENKKLFVGEDFFLILTGNTPRALWRRCPHLGCAVTYNPELQGFVCPCHQSRFDLTGKYLSGPAKKDLRPLKIRQTEGGLLVEIPA